MCDHCLMIGIVPIYFSYWRREVFSTKNFCNVSAFLSNVPGVVSPIGELNTYGYTFSREVGYFHHTSIDGYDLINLSSFNDGVKQAMPQAAVDQAIALVDHVVKATLGTSGELYYDEILLQLKTKAETINAISIEIGAMVSANGRWVPQWISWVDEASTFENTHKVWLSLPAYENQFTDYEIIVVPPFDDLDSFFNPGSIVENRIKAITPSQIMERADQAKERHPETLLRTDAYTYHDPAINATRRIDVYWTVLIYGPAGNDPDVIREALVEYILANSTHTRDEWAVIFPDIFKRTEFIFAPLWDQYASEQRVFDHGIYSGIVNHAKPVTWLTRFAAGYSVDHIKDKAQVMSFPYRSLQMAVIGHIENRDGKVQISDYFNDFINVGTDSNDFGRMSANTAEWALIMMDLITTAESLTAATDLPRGTYRLVRDGVTYLARSFNRVLLIVLAKSNTIVA